MEFKDLAPYQEAFETYLKAEQIEQNQPQALFAPIYYIMSIGGKRIRPILTLLAYELFAGRRRAGAPYRTGRAALRYRFDRRHS